MIIQATAFCISTLPFSTSGDGWRKSDELGIEHSRSPRRAELRRDGVVDDVGAGAADARLKAAVVLLQRMRLAVQALQASPRLAHKLRRVAVVVIVVTAQTPVTKSTHVIVSCLNHMISLNRLLRLSR